MRWIRSIERVGTLLIRLIYFLYKVDFTLDVGSQIGQHQYCRHRYRQLWTIQSSILYGNTQHTATGILSSTEELADCSTAIIYYQCHIKLKHIQGSIDVLECFDNSIIPKKQSMHIVKWWCSEHLFSSFNIFTIQR